MDTNADLFKPVETARLKLRCARPGDAARIAATITPAVSQWLASWPVPFTLEMAVEGIAAARRAAEEREALEHVSPVPSRKGISSDAAESA